MKQSLSRDSGERKAKPRHSAGDGTAEVDEARWEAELRPSTLGEYIGQENVKKSLAVMIEAAKKRGDAPDHLLFYGQAGLGKTTLANIVARELGVSIKVTSGPVIERAGDLASLLTNLGEGDIFFIDEIHRLARAIGEVLYSAMEDRVLNIMVGKGVGARTIALHLPPFTLVGATTRVDLVPGPLRSRFGGTFRLDYYEEEQMREIARRSARILGIRMDEEAFGLIARASRCTPRVVNRLLKRARDFSEVHGLSSVNGKTMEDVLRMLDIDDRGLEHHDRSLLSIILTQFGGGPVGVQTLSAALGEERGTIEEVYEPYLMKIGFLKRTSAGRVATEAGRQHLLERKT
ncbi:MAG: Holliday junction branch migration DNA helicase RuvB [Candidatus Colwellbacteria bacterium]|nr:Holliday junction branch migration DNA helicase RuvB [Candidatus Colwellbacteria bacterium]